MKKCRSRQTFGESGAWRPEDEERTYTCGLPAGHKGPHRGFELREVASWPQREPKKRTTHPISTTKESKGQ